MSFVPRRAAGAMLLLCALACAATPALAQKATKPAASTRKAPAAAPAPPPAPARAPATMGASGHGDESGTELGSAEIMDLNRMSQDTTRAADAVARLRTFLAGGPKPMFRAWATNTLLMALVTSRAPTAEVVVAADSVERLLPQDYQRRLQFYAGIAEVLGDRPDGVAAGLGYAKKALDVLPPTPDAVPLLGIARGVMGRLQLRNGETFAAIASLEKAVPDSPDSQAVLRDLGGAYEKAGRPDDAIGAYVRSLGVFAGPDSAAAAPLRALWSRKHGSLAGMDTAIGAARGASTRRIALDARRDQRPAPDFSLTKLTDTTATVSLADLKGKVVVIDFWGSWCGPCRIELPLFQKLADRHRERPDVAFLGINWERPGPTPNERRQRAFDYMAANQLVFPTVVDLDSKATQAFGVEGFPTVFVIDRQGTIRYTNRGFTPDVEHILEAQIQSLLALE